MVECQNAIKHAAVFYNSHEELCSFLSPYFKEGLDNNDLCLWILPEGLSVDQAQLSLRSHIPDVDQYIQTGRLRIEDHKTFYLKSKPFSSVDTIMLWEETEKSALQNNFSGVCAAGDGTWATKDSWFHLVLYEQDVDHFIHLHKMRAVCTYALAKLDLKKIFEIGMAHPTTFVNQREQWITLEPNHFHRSL